MAGIQEIALPKASRAVCCGMTETGKTTLCEKLIDLFMKQYQKSRVLIIDSKPRFRAQWELSGISAKWRYRKWGYGGYLPDSYRLPLGNNIKAELDTVWQSGGRIAIAQIEHLYDIELLKSAIDAFYNNYGATIPRLLDVDEVSDFYGGSGVAQKGDEITQIARSGRERNMALMVATQRPKGIPKQLLTEMSSLYLFHIDFDKDLQHLQEMGLPDTIRMPEDHDFLYWNKKLKNTYPSMRTFKLGGIKSE